MTIKSSVKIEGFDVYRRRMESLVKEAQGRIAEDGVAAGAAEVTKYAIENVHKVFSSRQTGVLANSIRFETKRKGKGAEAVIAPHTVYARIQELGGTIRPVKSPYLRFQVDGHWVKARSVTLPARPYLAPAVLDHKDQIAEAMGERLKESIEREARS